MPTPPRYPKSKPSSRSKLRLRWKNWIRKWREFRSRLSVIQQRDQVLAILLLLLWVGIILGNFVLRGNYIFEGNLIVSEMSFTYTGASDRRFLNKIDDVQIIDIEGRQLQPLTLTGTFSSDDPAVASKLQGRNQLTVELPQPNSRIIFQVADASQTSEISLLRLRINPNTRVNQLQYQSQPLPQLSFCLQSPEEPSDLCLLRNLTTSSSATSLGDFSLQLGQQPLTLTLETANIRELGIQSIANNTQTQILQYTPTSLEELSLTLSSPTTIFLDLPRDEINSLSNKQNNDNQDNQQNWFWQDFDVQDVRFSEFEQTENVKEELETSTILSGKVRLENQVMELQENQFLIVQSEKTGIRKLRFIQVHPKSPVGLETRISGVSQGIAVGLYKEFPVQSIEPTLLSKYLSQEAINALLAFIAAITGIFLPRLFPEPDNPNAVSKLPHDDEGKSV